MKTMRIDEQRKSYYQITFTLLCLCMIFVLVMHVVMSLIISVGMPNQADSAYLYYLSWLRSEGFVPYRDMYDTSFPGTFLIYGLITGLTGYSDLAFRMTDIGLLLLVSWLTWRLLGRFSRFGAVVCALCFADYLLANPTLALQRDYLGLVLVLISLSLMLDAAPDSRLRILLAGVLLGWAGAIKPHLMIGAPIIWLYGTSISGGGGKRILLLLSVAVLLVWCVFAAWMHREESLLPFIDMVRNFLPLYMQMDGETNEVVWSLPNVWYLIDGVLHVSDIPELVISVTVLLASLINGNAIRHWKLALMLVFMTIAYRLYALLGMKGWDYHFIPAQYFFISCFALLFAPYRGASWLLKSLHIFLTLLLLLALLVTDPNQLHAADNLSTRMAEVRKSLPLHAKELAGKQTLVAYLSSHPVNGCIEPRTQGTYGPIFPVMLELQLKPCTRFQLSQMFYHHVRDPYIQLKQHEYIETLDKSAPSLILDDGQFGFYNRFADKPMPTDRFDGTLRSSFEAYERFLESRYQRDFDNHLPYPDRVLVYQRSP